MINSAAMNIGVHVVSFRSGFLSMYAQKWDCWVIWQLYFQFFKKSPHLFSIVAVLVGNSNNLIQANLGDIAGSIPDHGIKASVTVK